MKKFGFLSVAAALFAMTFVSCEKKVDDGGIIIPPPEEIKVPAVEETAGAVTLVIKFDVAPCEGYDILFVGDYGDIEAAWNFAAAKKFEAIGEGWYKIVLTPNAEGNINGRPIQGKDGEGEWGNDWSHNGEDIVAVKNVDESNIADSGYGEINLAFTQAHADDAVVAYIECKAWNAVPCAAAHQYHITVTIPEFCEGSETPIEVIGGFNGWSDEGTVALVQKEGNVYEATVEAAEGTDWKVRGVGDWALEILGYVDDTTSEAFDSWIGVANNKFGAETEVVVNYGDPTKYMWRMCYDEPEVGEE